MCKMNVNLIHLFFVKNTYRKGLFIMSKKLVAFFSASGTTKKVAQMIAEEAKADLFEIEPKVPYTKLDLDWMNKKSRSSVEMSDKKYRPAIMKKEIDVYKRQVLMYLFQSVFNFFVVSGTGQAAITMPIMAPLSDLLGVSRQTAVVAFQLGDAFTNLIVPTSGCLIG